MLCVQRNSKHVGVVAHLRPGTQGPSQNGGPPLGISLVVSCTFKPGPGHEAMPPARPRLFAQPMCTHSLQLLLLLPLAALACLEALPF